MASKATIARLPKYLRYLREKLKRGEANVSSTAIADDMRLNPVNVRKDLAVVSALAGKPKLGFNVKELIAGIEDFLGLKIPTKAVLVGAGGLGRTLLYYEGFSNFGLKIVAAFDTKEAVKGTFINDVPVYSIELMKEVIQREEVMLGIIAVPAIAAQSVADSLVLCNIKGIWNFAPTHLNLPNNVALKNEDLAASLAVLTNKLSGTC